MLVCAKCKKEMQCIKTGMNVRFNENGSHVYRGDLFQCTNCGATIAHTIKTSTFDEDPERHAEPYDIWMDRHTKKVGKLSMQ